MTMRGYENGARTIFRTPSSCEHDAETYNMPSYLGRNHAHRKLKLLVSSHHFTARVLCLLNLPNGELKATKQHVADLKLRANSWPFS